ncbi:PTS glucose transporter subunit IIABC [Alkalicoccus saliphilus]|uniref:PTS glucose transporter subunit IIABC n=2 Tax=Alkalicoccus saliphilus TaxID=200989 RepID=A0A2T4U289_9BACI|nr:PTS glucose transporter subunit IIABC [Alkalicoccus saliphilus]
MTKLYSTITELGGECDMMKEENMLILFHEDVPQELKEIAVVHNNKNLQNKVESGDYLVLNEEKFEILFVGSKANETLEEMGHATIQFNGQSTSDLPGTICVEAKTIPALEAAQEIKIIRE